jgi:hypothetical protein
MRVRDRVRDVVQVRQQPRQTRLNKVYSLLSGDSSYVPAAILQQHS